MRVSIGRMTAVLAVLACTVLTACGVADDGTAPSPTGSPSAVPTRPTPTGSVDPSDPDPPSGLLVLPQQLNGFAISGQQVVFLVALDGAADTAGPGPGGSGDPPGGADQSDTRRASASDLPVTITAHATNAAATVVEPTLAEADDVAEVVVVPEPDSAGATVTVTITTTAAEVTDQETVAFDVVEGEDDRAVDAARMRDLFVPWLAADRPELGITETTGWQGTMVSPQWLVVSHYLFFSAEWEMHVEWHIMVAPDDWARIDLRRRFEETAPSEAFEISSVTEGGEPHPYEVPASIWR